MVTNNLFGTFFAMTVYEYKLRHYLAVFVFFYGMFSLITFGAYVLKKLDPFLLLTINIFLFMVSIILSPLVVLRIDMYRTYFKGKIN